MEVRHAKIKELEEKLSQQNKTINLTSSQLRCSLNELKHTQQLIEKLNNDVKCLNETINKMEYQLKEKNKKIKELEDEKETNNLFIVYDYSHPSFEENPAGCMHQ